MGLQQVLEYRYIFYSNNLWACYRSLETWSVLKQTILSWTDVKALRLFCHLSALSIYACVDTYRNYW